MAELFAANGNDADAALVLGRSDLQDSLMRVELHDDGSNEGEFKAYLRRPDGQVAGLVVRLFAEDGPLSDPVTALGHSGLLDRTFEVHVFQVQTPDGAEVKAGPVKPASEKNESAAAVLWKCSLWGDPKVWARIGSQEDYRQWLADHPEDLSLGDYRARRNWGWARIKDDMAMGSMRDAGAARIADYFARRGLLEKLPASIRDAAQAERLGAMQ